MAFLQQRVASSWKTVLELDPKKVATLGRGKSSDVVVEDLHCSRRQAEVFFADEQWMIRDVGSHNGTLVSGQPIHEAQTIRHGDSIRMGSGEFMFCHEVENANAFPGSVSAWVNDLKNAGEDDVAEFEIWKRYYDRLSRLAKCKLGNLPRRVADEEDAVAVAFHSFFEGVRNQEFPRLDDRNDLWGILATITARKVCRQIERETAQKRGGGQVAGESVFEHADDSDRAGLNAFARDRTDDELYVEFEDTWQQYMNALPDDASRQIVELKLAGYANSEIAAKIQVSLSTVERRLRGTRRVWDEQFEQRD